tara:strand:- start:1282 stop:1476 length:195 start_codon:yes stop_codon:yes gene_type:complete
MDALKIIGIYTLKVFLIIVFFLFFTPLSLILKLAGKDLLKRRFEKRASYWISRGKSINPMHKEF